MRLVLKSCVPPRKASWPLKRRLCASADIAPLQNYSWQELRQMVLSSTMIVRCSRFYPFDVLPISGQRLNVYKTSWYHLRRWNPPIFPPACYPCHANLGPELQALILLYHPVSLLNAAHLLKCLYPAHSTMVQTVEIYLTGILWGMFAICIFPSILATYILLKES